MVRAFIGIGANIGNRRETLLRAVERIDGAPSLRVVSQSTLHETDPVGVTDQPRFLNGVIEVETDLEPRDLLDRLLEIEQEFGRRRSRRRGPRTLDLDLLLYGDRIIEEPDLQVPHPRMHERDFVLEPLAEIAPDVATRIRKEAAS